MMSLPSFTLFNMFGTMWFIFVLFVVAKIISLEWKLHLKENIYFLLAVVIASIIGVVNRDIYNVHSHVLGDIAMLLALFFYFRCIKGYSGKKAFILLFIVIYTSVSMLFPLKLFFYYVFSDFGVGFYPDFLPNFNYEMPLLAISQVLLFLPFFTIPAVLVARLSGRARHIINQSNQLQTLFMCIAIAIMTIAGAFLAFWRFYAFTGVITPNVVFMFMPFIITFLMIFGIYVRYISAEYERIRNENEHTNLQYYTSELERQQIAIQKFKHDYQNILLSMRAFIQDKDWTGLEEYFSSKIEVVSEAVTKDSFALQGLGKIKVREIKSLLTAKLMMAQNMDMNIRIVFEANEDIEHIPIDSVALVRMLGIVLDNAVEALTEYGGGKLLVACHKWEAGTTFIVQNTCPPDMPPLHELLQPGFSTKGEGRGIGLSNLSEIADAHPNIILETSISDGNFIQRLLIENVEENK